MAEQVRVLVGGGFGSVAWCMRAWRVFRSVITGYNRHTHKKPNKERP